MATAYNLIYISHLSISLIHDMCISVPIFFFVTILISSPIRYIYMYVSHIIQLNIVKFWNVNNYDALYRYLRRWFTLYANYVIRMLRVTSRRDSSTTHINSYIHTCQMIRTHPQHHQFARRYSCCCCQ